MLEIPPVVIGAEHSTESAGLKFFLKLRGFGIKAFKSLVFSFLPSKMERTIFPCILRKLDKC